MHACAMKSTGNPNTANATMQREDEQGKAVSEITIYIQATLSVFANKDCIEGTLLTSASRPMPK
jgi:hypothetical protein